MTERDRIAARIGAIAAQLQRTAIDGTVDLHLVEALLAAMSDDVRKGLLGDD